jgi:hypothetical protein
MRWWLIFALSGFGCAAAQRPVPAPPPPRAEVVMADAAQAREPLVVPRRDAPVNRCLPSGLPAVSKPAERLPGATCRDHAPVERQLRALLTGSFQRSANGRVDVVFGCDPLGSEPTEVTFETGYGHGGSLTLWRLRRAESGSAFDVLGVASDGWITGPSEIDRATSLRVTRGSLAAQELERALITVRPALTAVVREVKPPLPPNSLGSSSMFYSSGNFHHFVRLTDQHNELEAGYTGYPHSGAQRVYVALEVAHDALTPLFEHFEFEREVAPPDLRDWFSAHVVAAWPRLQGRSAWWVRERLVVLAGKAGNASVVPLIVSQLERGLSEVSAAPRERATEIAERYLPEPLTALQQVTGWDARVGSNGTSLSLADSAQQAVAECHRAF